MKEENDVENDFNNEQTNNIIYFFQICENIFDNYILRCKYTFFDTLLNEWYKINKILITDKISDLENINSIYIYNCHKNLIYSMINISNKYKIKLLYKFVFIYNNDIINKKKIAIRKNIFNDFKMKINIKYKSINDLLCIKDLFFYYLMNNNIHYLQKENNILKNIIILKANNINEAYLKNKLYGTFQKLVLNSYKNDNKENIIYSNLDKVKYFQCNTFIYIYKKKLKHIYNIFINKILNWKNIYFIEKKVIKKNILFMSLIAPLNSNIINIKSQIFRKISYYYLFKAKMMFFVSIINIFLNSIVNKYKKKFMNNLKLYKIKNKNYYIYSFYMISNFISFKKYKLLFFSFNSIRSNNNKYFKMYNKINIKNKARNIPKLSHNKNKTKIKILLIKLINIYYKYHNFKNWKIKQNFFTYFNKWKSKTKLYQYKEYIQYNNIIKKKFEKYNIQNNIMKHKLEELNNKYKKKKISNDLKEKINSKKKINIKRFIMPVNISNIIKARELNEDNNLKLNYLDGLEELKNNNELIISDLQSEINNLINEIELLSINL